MDAIYTHGSIIYPFNTENELKTIIANHNIICAPAPVTYMLNNMQHVTLFFVIEKETDEPQACFAYMKSANEEDVIIIRIVVFDPALRANDIEKLITRTSDWMLNSIYNVRFRINSVDSSTVVNEAARMGGFKPLKEYPHILEYGKSHENKPSSIIGTT